MTKSDSSIEIRDLYKIFGSHPQKFVEAVKGGMSKAELAKAHGHILGLNNINISMPAGRIQVVMGLSGSGKSTLIRHINRLRSDISSIAAAIFSAPGNTPETRENM